MDIINSILIVVGLILFEVISSIDNAVINAEVLGTMSKKARKWFLFWGILFAVFLVRGLLPWLIIWATVPKLGFIGSFLATFSSDPLVMEAVDKSAPVLLAGGGVFLVFLFFHWLFLEPKNFGLHTEKFFARQGVWFYAVVSIVLSVFVWYALKINQYMAFGAVLGSTAFFITHGFKQNAEKMEHEMLHKGSLTDWAKIMYLEVIDATFSIDGVLGAFAFTLSVPLILIGNGIGAIVVRYMTTSNIEAVKKYKYLKNGAMYSVFVLGVIMLVDSFGVHVPSWVSPIATITVLAYFFLKSKRELNLSVHTH